MELLVSLRRELSQIEAELRADPRAKKAEMIRSLIAEYETSSLTSKAKERAGVAVRKASGHRKIARPNSKSSRVKSEISALLAKQGATHRKAILSHLKHNGLMGKEKNPLQALAAYLSGWKDDFASDGEGNFSLAKVRDQRDT